MTLQSLPCLLFQCVLYSRLESTREVSSSKNWKVERIQITWLLQKMQLLFKLEHHDQSFGVTLVSFNALHREDVVFEPNFVLPIPLLQIFPHGVGGLPDRTDVVEAPNALGELLELIPEI